MTWTYGSDPQNNTRDEVRLLSGDVLSTRPTHLTNSDEEIAYFIAEEGSGAPAAIAACEALAAKWAAEPENQKTGGLSITNGDMVKKFRDTAEMLRIRKLAPVPYLGGQSVADKETDQQDTDNVGPRFYRGMGNDPEAMSGDDYTDEATS